MAADVISAFGGSLFPKLQDIFNEDVSLNLPSDDISKWLRHIVPISILAAHTVMIFIDTNDKGHCFVPTSTDGKQLTPSQVQYITEFCVSQVTHYACFEDDGTLKNDCKSINICHYNTSSPDPGRKDERSTLYLYRYYFFFLSLFSFCHVLVQKIWKLLFASVIRPVIENLVPLVEIRHALKHRRVSPDGEEEATNSTEMETIAKHVKAIEYRAYKSQNSFTCSRIFRSMWLAYLIRTLLGLLINYLFYSNVVTNKSNLINSEVFVCDLHRDRSNVYLCDTLTQQFIPCTISFELETQTTKTVLKIIMLLDTSVQVSACFYWLIKLIWFQSKSFTLPYNTELQIDHNDQWSKFVLEKVSSVYPFHDLLFVEVLYRQNNDKHDPLLKTTVEKMFDEIFILKQTVTNGGIHEGEMETLMKGSSLTRGNTFTS